MEVKENRMSRQKYVDILSLGGFNAFFGDANNKDVIMTIMNELLPEHRKVVDIDFMPTDYPGPIIGYNKDFRYDFMCHDESGAVFIVELQKYYEKAWFKRCVSYASRAYDRQNRSGENYDVPPVYLIGLMGVAIDHQDKEYWKDRYVSEYTFREKESHDLLDETIVIIFAELVNFNKSEEECITRQDRMLYLLKNSSKLIAPPSWSEQEQYTNILAACNIEGFDEEKKNKYDTDMYDERRRRGELDAAIEMGEASGRIKGREEGRGEAKAEVARNMLAAGMPVEQISSLTGLDVAEIEKLR